MFGQHTSGGYKPFLSQYGLKGKVKTLKEFNGYHWATYHFNKEGLLTQTDNRTFTYDEQNRLKTISYKEGKSSFTYLPNNEVKEEVSGLGRETYYYVYDNKGNLLSKERKLRKDSRSSLDYKILYKYDKAGRLLEKKYDPSYLKKTRPSLQDRTTQGQIWKYMNMMLKEIFPGKRYMIPLALLSI